MSDDEGAPRRHRTCPHCGRRELSPLGATYEHAGLVRCRSCRLVFASVAPTESRLREHYNRYRRAGTVSPVTVARYQALLEHVEPLRGANRILDVGCGDGFFLLEAQRLGWSVVGLEYTEEAAAAPRAHGIPTHVGAVQSLPTSEPFDVITSFEVLEHLNDGPAHVQALFRLLRPGGVLSLTTPNFSSLSRRLLRGSWYVIGFPEHLTYYTPRTADRLLTGAGFVRESLRTTGFVPARGGESSPRPGSSPRGGACADPEGTRTPRRQMAVDARRAAIERSTVLRAAKLAADSVLSVTRLGDTLKAEYRRP